jgi:uncharacterized protein
MRIALISDTHDNIDNILKATREFNERRADIVIHAGDYVSPISVESFMGVKLIGILGNNDTDVPGLTSAFNKIGGELKGEIFESQYDGLNFAVYHGTNFNKKELLINSAKYDVFICGHTHRTLSTTFGKTIVINPGTANGWFLGYKATAAIFDTTDRHIEFINL